MSNPEEEELQKLMEATSDTALGKSAVDEIKPTDSITSKQTPDSDIPDDELTEVVMSDLRNDMQDKEDFGWTDKREYDLKAYYGQKNEFLMNYPYPNASAYPVPITSVLLDTGHAMIDDLVWRNPNKCVTVKGVGDEDIKKAKHIESLLNWQCLNDIEDMKIEDSASNFFMLLHGTGYEKIIVSGLKENYGIRPFHIPIENIYLPIDAKSPEIGDSDHIIQIIPLSANDLRQRIASGVYRNLDKVGKGFVPGSTTAEQLKQMMSDISGLDLSQKQLRDTWYIGEYYKTFYPKGSLKSVELIVHFSPTTGAILRKIINKENIRPFVDKHIYPNYGKAFHISLPEKIKNIQEKADYTDKQATDGADKALSPAGFYDGSEKFDPRINLRVPTSMYPMRNVNSIQFEPINIAPLIYSRQEVQKLWLEAERATGFTDLNQGVVSASTAPTLGQDVLRSQRADIRFSKIVKLVNYHWKKKIGKIYKYDDIYMPRSTKVKVLGVTKYQSIESLFPSDKVEGELQSETGIGFKGRLDFSIANKTIEQQENENQIRAAFYSSLLVDPLFGQDKGNHYRALEMQSEAMGIEDLEYVIKKPKEANAMTSDEIIAKLYDGEEVMPQPESDQSEIITAIDIFMRSGNFKDLSDDRKKKFMLFRFISNRMRQAQVLAFEDFNVMQNPPIQLIPPGEVGTGNVPIPTGGSVPPVPAIRGNGGGGAFI